MEIFGAAKFSPFPMLMVELIQLSNLSQIDFNEKRSSSSEGENAIRGRGRDK
jgi:hypothetical protein